MTRFVGTPLRGIEFSSVSDEAISARVNGDGHPRIRIDAGGRITWSAGASAGDTTLYRDGENHLRTDDVFEASGGLITIATDGAPTVALPDGALAIDTTNHVFYFRSNNLWNQVTGGGGGGASIEISDTPPSEPSEGDLWYESDTGSMFVYYDSAWIETGGASDGGASTLDALLDVVITSPTNGQVLKYDGTQWINDTDDAGTTINSLDDIGDVNLNPLILEAGQSIKYDGTDWVNDFIVLGTDTKGDYLYDITAGTGVTVTHSPNEGSTATIEIGQSVGTTDAVEFGSVTTTGGFNINIEGSTWGSFSPAAGDVELSANLTDGDLKLTSQSGSIVIHAYGTDTGEGVSITGQSIDIFGAIFADSDLTVMGNLTINGTTTTLNTENLLVEDNIITLNSGVTGSPLLNAGVEVERGTSPNVEIRWNETSDKWELTNNGSSYDGIQTETEVNILQQKVKNQMVYLMCEVGP